MPVPSAVGITEIEIYEMVKTKDVHYGKVAMILFRVMNILYIKWKFSR